jgi:hypothetical protein
LVESESEVAVKESLLPQPPFAQRSISRCQSCMTKIVHRAEIWSRGYFEIARNEVKHERKVVETSQLESVSNIVSQNVVVIRDRAGAPHVDGSCKTLIRGIGSSLWGRDGSGRASLSL